MGDPRNPAWDDLPQAGDAEFRARLDALLDGGLNELERSAFLLDAGRSHETRQEVLALTGAVAALRAPVDAPDLRASILSRMDSKRRFLPSGVRRWLAPARLGVAASIGALLFGLLALRTVMPAPVGAPEDQTIGRLAEGGVQAAAGAQQAVARATSLTAGIGAGLREGVMLGLGDDRVDRSAFAGGAFDSAGGEVLGFWRSDDPGSAEREWTYAEALLVGAHRAGDPGAVMAGHRCDPAVCGLPRTTGGVRAVSWDGVPLPTDPWACAGGGGYCLSVRGGEVLISRIAPVLSREADDQ